MTVPKYIHIGLPRSGSTTLQRLLGSDERIHMFKPDYFNTTRWYVGPFDEPPSDGRVRVLSDETLVRQKHSKLLLTIERIARTIPDAEIILTLREQRSWLESRYKYGVGGGALSCSFSQWLDSPNGVDMLSLAAYATLYRNLRTYIPAERIHILFFEDLKKDYDDFFKSLYLILDLPIRELSRLKENARQPDEALWARRLVNRIGIFDRGRGWWKKERSVHKTMAAAMTEIGRSLGQTAKGPMDVWGDNDYFTGLEAEFRLTNQELMALSGLDLESRGYLT